MFEADEALTSVHQPLDFLSSYKPKVFDQQDYQFHRLLCEGRVLEGQLGDCPVKLYGLPYRPVALVSPLDIRVTLPQFEFYLQIGLDCIDFAMGQLAIPDALEQLSSALKESVCVAFLDAFFAQVFDVSPLRIQVLEPFDVPHQLCQATAKLYIQKDAWINLQVQVAIHHDFLPNACQWLSHQSNAQLAPNAIIAAIQMPVMFILDEFFIAQTLLESVQLNDLIMIETSQAQGQTHGIVRVANTLQQRGVYMDDSLVLDGYLEDFNHTMSDSEKIGQESAEGFHEAQDLFKDLPVKMTFELGQVQMTLAELRQLNEGQSITVPKRQSSVHVLANGQPFAKGEIVRVDNQIGVRLLHFLQ